MVYVYSCVKERVNAAERSKERGRAVQYGTKNLINFLLLVFSAKFCMHMKTVLYEYFSTGALFTCSGNSRANDRKFFDILLLKVHFVISIILLRKVILVE